MRRFLREPLLHFFVLGIALSGLYGALQRGEGTNPNEIVLSRGQVDSLQSQFERVWQRPPTPAELRGLIDTWVRDEIFYREGLALGLDRDDPIVRRRIGQKLEFIVDSATPPTPTPQDLQAWLDTHAARYAVEPTYSLRQVYFDPSRHGDQLNADIAAARGELERGKSVHGDSTLLPPMLEAAQPFEIARAFGKEFADAVAALPVGGWQGPIRSGFGVHLVQLTAHEPGRDATLSDVRALVERDWLQARTQERKDALYQRLRANYTVRTGGRDERAGDGVDAAAGPFG